MNDHSELRFLTFIDVIDSHLALIWCIKWIHLYGSGLNLGSYWPSWARRGSSIRCASAWYADGRDFDLHVQQNILALRFGHENVSTTILSLLLIQEGPLSVTGERMDPKYW